MPFRKFLMNRYKNRKFRLDGIFPSIYLPSKQCLCQAFSDNLIYNADELPPKVDLRQDMTPVEDQSRLGSW